MTLGVLIRKVKSVDHQSIEALLKAAFMRPDEAVLVKELWAQQAVKFERVAEIGGEIAGYICYSAITTTPALDGVLLGLGPLAVAPHHQRQGVGANLVHDTLKICHDHDARLIAVLGDPAYYAKFGFEPAEKRKFRWAGFDAGDAFRVISGDDIDTAEVRTINYHPAFETVS